MAFSAQELQNIANGALDWYIRGDAWSSTIQDKPLLAALDKGKKTFAGGKGNISLPVKGDYTTAIQGYNHNDTVTYANPANVKRVVYPWKEVHAGIGVTFTELKIDGISVTDSTTGKSTSEHSDREMSAITNLLDDKLEDMAEGYARTTNTMLWKDGTQDSKLVPGITSIILDNPAVGTTGGLDRSVTTWWRNRALVGSNKIVSSTTLQTLSITLRSEMRQLQRFSKSKNYFLPCGSKFLDLLGAEIQSKGIYTQEGFSSKGKNDIGMNIYSLRGLGDFVYDPTLDDLGLSDRLYVLDMDAIKLMPMEGEENRTHNPARPYNQYALYRAMTWTGGLTAQQLNSSGTYQAS